MNMEQLKHIMKEWVIPLALEALVILFFLKYVAFLVKVPTGSMIPTIDEHSWLIATRVYNPEKSVKRGDIVAFNSDELDLILIKRCVGLPGETVDVNEDGVVFINGVKLDEPYVKNQQGISGHFEIPEDCYLFFGDNRSGSNDARSWDNPYIPGDKIFGEAHFTLFPFKNFGLLN